MIKKEIALNYFLSLHHIHMDKINKYFLKLFYCK